MQLPHWWCDVGAQYCAIVMNDSWFVSSKKKAPLLAGLFDLRCLFLRSKSPGTAAHDKKQDKHHRYTSNERRAQRVAITLGHSFGLHWRSLLALLAPRCMSIAIGHALIVKDDTPPVNPAPVIF